MELVALGCRFVLGVVFLLAGLAKLPRRHEFEATVRGYELLPPGWVPTVARSVPAVELVAGGFLLVGFETRWIALVTAVVLAAFTSAVVVNLVRGRELDCGCYAVGAPRRIGWVLVARNVGFLALALIVVISAPRVLGVDEVVLGRGGSRIADGDAFAVVIAAFVFVIGAAIVTEALQLRDRYRAYLRVADRPVT